MKITSAFFLFALLLSACQPGIASQPTTIPPTIPPSFTPTSAPTPTPVSVEALANSTEELIGVWFLAQCPCKLEFKPDGTYRVWDSFSGTQAEGDFTLADGKVTWVTSQPTCNDQPATYEAYVTKVDGKPTSLRLVLVGSDPCSARTENSKGVAKLLSP